MVELMGYKIVDGNLLNQRVEVIVNSWNRNIIPWWLLIPQGVSGAIKKHGGIKPFREIAKYGAIPLGEARETSAGKLPFKAIIHVTGINLLWFATEYSVAQSVKNAMNIVNEKQYSSIAFPIIGSGSGNRSTEWALQIMTSTLEQIESSAEVIIVRFQP